jgi:hypothetical protein
MGDLHALANRRAERRGMVRAGRSSDQPQP